MIWIGGIGNNGKLFVVPLDCLGGKCGSTEKVFLLPLRRASEEVRREERFILPIRRVVFWEGGG